MAQKATIYKVELSVSDMDRHCYGTHNLTVAKHPSETDERLILRILAFALNVRDRLEFSKGLSSDDEPDIWQKSRSGELELWVILGLPSEKIIRQSCGRANEVVIYSYGGRAAELWWEKIKNTAMRSDNLRVVNVSYQDSKEVGQLLDRSVKMLVSVEDNDVMISVGEAVVYMDLIEWRGTAD